MAATKKKTDHRRAKGRKKKGQNAKGRMSAAMAAKAAEAIDYRIQGHSYEEIGQAIGVSTTTAYRLVTRGLDEKLTDAAEGLIKVQVARLEALIAPHMTNALKGDVNSTSTLLSVMERLDRYAGVSAGRGKLSIDTQPGADGAPRTTKIEVEFI